MLKNIKKNIALYKIAKTQPDPELFSISENLAFIIDDKVVEIMHCQPKLASILLSQPKIIKIEKEIIVKPGYLYLNETFINPNTYKPQKEYPHGDVNDK
jgi:hypothetical protein